MPPDFFCPFFERKMLKQVQDDNDPINKNALKVIALLQFEVNESIHQLLLFFIGITGGSRKSKVALPALYKI